MYSFPNLEPVCCFMSNSNCCFLTNTDFPGGNSGGLVFPSLEEFSTVCCDAHSQRFSLVNEAEVNVSLEFSCFSMIHKEDTVNLISGSSAFFKTSLNIWKFTVHVLLKPGYIVVCKIIRRRQWQPTPVLVPGKSHGWRSLVGCSPWGSLLKIIS